jgi:hypothetical protein
MADLRSRGSEGRLIIRSLSRLLDAGSDFARRLETDELRAGCACRPRRQIQAPEAARDFRRVEPPSVIPNGPFSATFVGRTSPKTEQADSSLSVIRRRHVGRGIREDLEIRNHTADPLRIHVGMEAGTDFASLFDVKSGRTRLAVRAHGRATPGGISFSNPDQSIHTELRFHPLFDNDDDRIGAGWAVIVPGRGSWRLCTEISAKLGGSSTDLSYKCGDAVADAIPVQRLDQWHNEVPGISAADPRIQRATDQAIEDLGALRIFDPDHPQPGGRCRRRSLVHDPVRPRLDPCCLDGPSRRSRSGSWGVAVSGRASRDNRESDHRPGSRTRVGKTPWTASATAMGPSPKPLSPSAKWRLPELFAGFAANDLAAPVPYPSSCSPQACAAAAPLLLVRSLLGLESNAPNQSVRVRPSPASSLKGFTASGIPLAGGRISITYQDGKIRPRHRRGGIGSCVPDSSAARPTKKAPIEQYESLEPPASAS